VSTAACCCCLQGFAWPILVFVTPLFFGMCHLHHGWGMVQLYGWSVRVAALCLLQFLYTTVFGWFATWILLSTGSTAAAVLVHSLCNVMGLPPFHHMGRFSLCLCVTGLVLFLLIAPRVLLQTAHSAFWWGPVLP
jgi:prenyl protein peptidase